MLVADSETTLDRFCNKRNIVLIEKDNALYTKDDIPKVVKIHSKFILSYRSLLINQ